MKQAWSNRVVWFVPVSRTYAHTELIFCLHNDGNTCFQEAKSSSNVCFLNSVNMLRSVPGWIDPKIDPHLLWNVSLALSHHSIRTDTDTVKSEKVEYGNDPDTEMFILIGPCSDICCTIRDNHFCHFLCHFWSDGYIHKIFHHLAAATLGTKVWYW